MCKCSNHVKFWLNYIFFVSKVLQSHKLSQDDFFFKFSFPTYKIWPIFFDLSEKTVKIKTIL